MSTLFKRLYEDHVLQRITAEQFRMLSADYNTEQKTLQETILEEEVRLEKLKASAANAEAFIEKTRRFTATICSVNLRMTVRRLHCESEVEQQ